MKLISEGPPSYRGSALFCCIATDSACHITATATATQSHQRLRGRAQCVVVGVAARTILSTALLFLLAGALIGQGGFGLVTIGPHDPLVTALADIALFMVLCSPTVSSRTTATPTRLPGYAAALGRNSQSRIL